MYKKKNLIFPEIKVVNLCCPCDSYPPRCSTPYRMKLMRSLKSCGWKVQVAPGERLMWWRMASEISLISGWLWLLHTNKRHIVNHLRD